MENYDYLCSGITVEGVVDSMVSFSTTKNLSKNFCFSIFICIFAQKICSDGGKAYTHHLK